MNETVRRLTSPLVLLLLAGALVVTGVNYTRHTEIIKAIQSADGHTEIIGAIKDKEAKMQSLKASWVSENITHTVTTPRLPDETNPVWIARHKASVDAMKAAFPPTP